ncbi:MAG: DNA-binding transcriptional regulator Fis [Chromatiaceae bacterium]|nr:DNA-binding transcriptional regulator Fis [Gammaproteobacteria bacterium]MCP5427023.1 DNA-binding transcriptional regulator Fis [Chromatiaceae bacterium]MCB1861629.1 DNA-binding transcriptional regulator Fis [Gammaproteobacteria bacterium]MCB1873055.1 DNA-binding transcriptional regulator Fis [Gammaproteobacteria bacterium]MCB1879811.1 DNA-binding transcriptional regulator Fis [Gammaproteobacteria bacterium]
MTGAAIQGNQEQSIPFTVSNKVTKEPLRECVRDALDSYFIQLDGYTAAGLYQMVLAEVEHPLLETVMKYAEGNQTKAAALLGISRSTLRKKLNIYQLD